MGPTERSELSHVPTRETVAALVRRLRFLRVEMPAAVAEFIEHHRDDLMEKWETKVRAALPSSERHTHDQLRDNLHLFLDETLEGLVRHQQGRPPLTGGHSPIASEHGGQRQVLQFDLTEVVTEYRLLHESIAELADEMGVMLSVPGVTTLTSLLFSGAAAAVKEYTRRQEAIQHREHFEYFAFVAHELRNPLTSMQLAWDATRRSGTLDLRRSDLISRGLQRLRDQIDHAITHSRLAASREVPELRLERIDLDVLIADACDEATVDAEAKKIRIDRATAGVYVVADLRLLRSAFSNLLRNAIKYTHPDGTVSVRCQSRAGRVRIDVEDECGGLQIERAEKLFESFTQASRDRSGFGLGLAISKQAIDAHDGVISITNLPDKGCIFTIDLPADAVATNSL